MKSLIKKNQKVNIIPENIKGAAEALVLKSLKNSIEIEIPESEVQFYSKNGEIELFAPVEEGMLYFSSVIDDLENNTAKIKTPLKYDILQRREFSRIPVDKKITLKENNLTCKCLDISAGGMKLEVNKQLDMEKDYTIDFSLENNVNISCYLRPIRISSVKNAKTPKYIVSGRFVLLKNIDKIAIVQYCFKKNIENTNK